jgi:hypothetical protein
VILTMPLLEGLDGVNKMSKSLGNYVGVDDAPNDMFGKLMSVSDTLMWRYIELLSFASLATIAEWKKELEGGGNPRDVKVRFAQEIVTRFHSAAAARAALEDFESRFRHGGVPEDLEEQLMEAPAEGRRHRACPQVGGDLPFDVGGAADDRAGGREGERRKGERQGLEAGGRGHICPSGGQAEVREGHPEASRVTREKIEHPLATIPQKPV